MAAIFRMLSFYRYMKLNNVNILRSKINVHWDFWNACVVVLSGQTKWSQLKIARCVQ
jgi:hypothetical protein